MAQATTDKVHVYGLKQDGGLWHVGTHVTYGNFASSLTGYRAYECNRRQVDQALREGVPICAAWDGNRYVFSPVEMDLVTGEPVEAAAGVN